MSYSTIGNSISMNPDYYAKQYAAKNNLSVDEAKEILKSQYGEPSQDVSDNALFQFKDTQNTDSLKYADNEQNPEYKTDAQQLNEDAVYLASLYQRIQNGDMDAIKEASSLQVADDPDSGDNSSNAQILRSNNELAQAIKSMIGTQNEDKKENKDK